MIVVEVIGMEYVKKDGSVAISYTKEERAAALDVSLTSLASSLGYMPLRIGSHRRE